MHLPTSTTGVGVEPLARQGLDGFTDDKQVVQDRGESDLDADVVTLGRRQLKAIIGDPSRRNRRQDVTQSIVTFRVTVAIGVALR